jgi:hypothetical protein
MMTPKQAERSKQHDAPKQPEAPATTPTTEPTPAPAPAAAVSVAAVQPIPAPTKQQTTIGLLIEAWTKRGVDLSKISIKDDGKFKNIQVGEGWPLIVVGVGGGINLPEIKSYPSAFPAAVEGDKLLAKQIARTQKAAAPATPTVVTVKATVVPDQAKAADAVTPAQRKKQADAQLEKRLEQRA